MKMEKNKILVLLLVWCGAIHSASSEQTRQLWRVFNAEGPADSRLIITLSGPVIETPHEQAALRHFNHFVNFETNRLSSTQHPVYRHLTSAKPLYSTTFTTIGPAEEPTARQRNCGYFDVSQCKYVQGDSQSFFNRYKNSSHTMWFDAECGSQGFTSPRIRAILRHHGEFCGYTTQAKVVVVVAVPLVILVAKKLYDRRTRNKDIHGYNDKKNSNICNHPRLLHLL